MQLHSAGLVTIRAIAFVPKKKLLEVTGLSDKTVDDIKVVKKLVQKPGTLSLYRSIIFLIGIFVIFLLDRRQ